jgi:hypothetical protein
MSMFILNATTKSIVATMSGAAATTNPDFTAAWADNDGTTFTEGSSDGALNGTSQVTVVAAPAASTRRTIKSITIENRDTAAVTVTLSYNNNSTLRTIAVVTLAVGDTWTLNGTFDTAGALKQTLGTVNLATQVTGTLPVANGGTGSGTAAGARTNLGLGTMAVQDASSVVITGGSIGSSVLVNLTNSTGNISGGTY